MMNYKKIIDVSQINGRTESALIESANCNSISVEVLGGISFKLSVGGRSVMLENTALLLLRDILTYALEGIVPDPDDIMRNEKYWSGAPPVDQRKNGKK